MAVAVKNSPETSTSSAFDRMPVVSLVGVVYVLSSLAIVFGLLPYLWWQMWGSVFGTTNTFASGTLLGMLMLAAFTGLVVLGGQLLGPKAPTGVRGHLHGSRGFARGRGFDPLDQCVGRAFLLLPELVWQHRQDGRRHSHNNRRTRFTGVFPALVLPAEHREMDGGL